MKAAGLANLPVVVGGIIPPQDAGALKAAGVAEVYTPKDFELNRIVLICTGLPKRRLRVRPGADLHNSARCVSAHLTCRINRRMDIHSLSTEISVLQVFGNSRPDSFVLPL